MIRRLHYAGAALAIALSGLAAPALGATPGQADAAANAGVPELVVTAEKREENIQNVPLSIMAVSQQQMQVKGVQNAQDLTRIIPNFVFVPGYQSTATTLQIRGFGTNGNNAIDPSAATYLDGVYIPHPGEILATFLDVSSVEVLRGPQGTLFGRNSTAGALSVHTYEPANAFSGYVAGQAGNFGSYQGEGVVNLPVTSDFAIRIAGLANTTSGYVHNLHDGKTYGAANNDEARISAKWTPTDKLSWVVRFDYAHTGGDGTPGSTQVDLDATTPAQFAAFSKFVGGNLPTIGASTWDVNQTFENPTLSDSQWGINSQITWEAFDGYTFRLIDSYRDWHNTQQDGDIVFTPLALAYRDGYYTSKSQSHELQFISPKGALLGGKLDFVSGLYFFQEDFGTGEIINLASQFCPVAIGGLAPGLVKPCEAGAQLGATTNVFGQRATSYAGYFQADYAITPQLVAVVGARETHDDKQGSFFQTIANPVGSLLRAPESDPSLSTSDTQPTWLAGLNWHIDPDVMAFVTYSTGYKSGGLNSTGGSPALTPATRAFKPETSDDWELGLKSTFFDRRLLLNVTGYRTEITNFQARTFSGVNFIIRNSGGILAQGVEIESEARPDPHLTLDLAVAYRDAYYTNGQGQAGLPGCTGKAGSCPTIVDLTGQQLAQNIPWSGDLGAQYDSHPFWNGFTLSVRSDVNFRSGFYGTGYINPQGHINPVALLGGRIGLTSPDKTWILSFVGENLMNKGYFEGSIYQVLDSIMGVRNPVTGTSLVRGFMGPPRTWYFRLEKRF